MEIGVGRWANKEREQGCQNPKLLNGSESGIYGLGFVFVVVVNPNLAFCGVGYAWRGHESDAWSVTPFSVLNVGN